MILKNLERKIKNKTARIGIIGIGYVGLPLAISFSNKNFKNIIGIEKNKEIIKKLIKNQSHISHISSEKIKKLNNNNFKITDNFNVTKILDVIIICLPTPLKKNLSPDMSFIKECMKDLIKFLKPNQLIILESTVYPGATDDLIVNKLKKKYTIGKNFFIAYSPEREDPGNQKFSSKNVTKLVSGKTKICLRVAKTLYSSVFNKVWALSNIKSCEMTKLYENIYRSINIGMANEMKLICNKLGVDIYEIIEAAKTKPFGFNAFYPGPGLGGHCIPIDPLFITWWAKKNKISAEFISLSHKINKKMPSYVFNKFLKIKEKYKIKNIFIFGVAYKKNIDDIRESPAISLIEMLIKKKIKFRYHDPYVKRIKVKSIIVNSSKISYLKKIKNCLAIIITDHDKINYKQIERDCDYIIDTRGRYKKDNKKIFSA